MAVTEDGAVFAWGRGTNGALGDGMTADSNVPVRVVLPAVSDVAAGDSFSLALTTDGRVYAWGDDTYGELGNGTISNTGATTPVAVTFPAGVSVAQISAGQDFALARTTSGAVYAWGDNVNGQLGDGTTTVRPAPVQVALPSGVTALQVAAGTDDGYAVTTANRVLAWGAGAAGQLGNGDTSGSALPVYTQLPAGTYVTSVAGGGGYALAVTQAGGLLAWGGGGSYDLGDGSTANQPAPTTVPLPAGTVVTSAAAAAGFSFAVDSAGHAWGWGSNAYGELADGTTTTRSTPEQLSVAPHVTAAAGGAQHSLFVAAPTPVILAVTPGIVPPAGGTITIQGTGFTGATVVRVGTTRARITSRTSTTLVAAVAAAAPGRVAVRVTAPGGTSATTTPDLLSYVTTGSVVGWGADYTGSLGDGDHAGQSDRPVPVGAAALAGFDFAALVPGSIATYGITSGGAVYAWGDNEYGELGNGTLRGSSTPVRVALPAGVVATSVTAGEDAAYVVTSTGQVYGWGDNSSGELGDGTLRRRLTPVLVALPTGVRIAQASAGYQDALARTTSGKAFSWGYNGYGELGDGTTTDRTKPLAVHLPRGTSLTQLVAGYYHCLALTTSGTVLGWGDNGTGDLGDGTTVSSYVPVAAVLPAGVTVRQLVAHYQFSSVLTAAGTVYDWGRNDLGQLGNGTTTNSPTPVAVAFPAGTTITQLGDGYYTTPALSSAGDVYGWGLNNFATIGDGTRTVHDTPVRAAFPAGVAASQVLGRGDSELAIVR